MIWLNDMPDDKGIYGKYSPRHIFTGREIYYTKHCKAVFRDYVEAIEDAAVKNYMKPRIRQLIVLGPSGNIQGSTKHFDTLMGNLLNW